MTSSLIAGVFLALFANMVAAQSKPPPAKPTDFPNVKTPEASIYRGDIVFKHYCATCHGVKADGNGRAAKLYTPKPANLVLSDKNMKYKELIIRQGGKALGRSEFMPIWKEELTEEQITDVVNYLESIAAHKY